MPPKRRVLQVLQPPDGGVATHVLELARGLIGLGWEVDVAAGKDNVALPALRDLGARVHVLPLVRTPGVKDLRALRALRELDRRERYTVVHAHSSKAGALTRLALPDRGRLVYTPHCFSFAFGYGRLWRIVYRGVEQVLTWRTAAIVAVSSWEAQEAKANLIGASRRVRVIPNGAPALPPTEPDAALVAFKRDSVLAGWFAKLRPQKDPLAAVHAMAIVARGGRANVRLAIVGNGALEREVRMEIERLGLQELVRWFPFEGASGRYLRAFDLLLLSSRWESLPFGPLEAMSCGLPVVATAVGGVPEIVQDGVTGRLTRPGDAAALAAALEETAADVPRLRAMGEAARQVVQHRFSLEAMVERTAELYEEIVERCRT